MTPSVAAAGRARAADVSRPRLLPALARREFDVVSGVLLGLGSLSAAAAAHELYGADAEGTLLPLIGQLLRRFDLTVLGIVALVLVLRCAARIEADHADGWLACYLAAGGSRWAYGSAFALTALMAPAAVFAGAAVTFAISVAILTDSVELLRLLPRTLGAGLLVLGTYSVSTVAVGTILRRASTTAVVIGALVVFPVFLTVRHAISEVHPPIRAMSFQLLSPLVFAPQDSANILRAIIYILTGWCMTAFVSHRYAGRHQ
jgi:hypothetical protein